jgi:hypothetical protein
MWSVPGQTRIGLANAKKARNIDRFDTIKGVWHPRVLASQSGQDERRRRQDDRIRTPSWIRVIM